MQIRATNPEDKELRRETILDAAEQLWLSQPERMANVAEIATVAGLTKGTVYLYFRFLKTDKKPFFFFICKFSFPLFHSKLGINKPFIHFFE